MGWVDRRLFHSDSATVSQCDHSCCYMYLLFETLHDITKLRVFFLFYFYLFIYLFYFFFLGGGGGGGGGESSPVYYVFGFVDSYTDLGRRGYFGVLRRSCSTKCYVLPYPLSVVSTFIYYYMILYDQCSMSAVELSMHLHYQCLNKLSLESHSLWPLAVWYQTM